MSFAIARFLHNRSSFDCKRQLTSENFYRIYGDSYVYTVALRSDTNFVLLSQEETSHIEKKIGVGADLKALENSGVQAPLDYRMEKLASTNVVLNAFIINIFLSGLPDHKICPLNG